MATAFDTLLNVAAQQGLNVVVKTRYGPEMLVYNAATPSTSPSFVTQLLGPVGIQLRDASGKVLYSNNVWPDTNPLAILGLAGALGLLFGGSFLAIRKGF